jgi:hypothetical protein
MMRWPFGGINPCSLTCGRYDEDRESGVGSRESGVGSRESGSAPQAPGTGHRAPSTDMPACPHGPHESAHLTTGALTSVV